MTNKSLLTRRRLLQATGSSLVVGLAGCTGSQTTDGSTTEPHVRSTTESGHGHEEGSHHETESGHGGDGHGHSEAIGAPTDTAEVKMVTQDGGFHFEPHVVRVKP